MNETPSNPAILVGPAGWSYTDWEGIVYPHHKPRGFHEAAYLAQFFDTIEINTSFYSPPRAEVVKACGGDPEALKEDLGSFLQDHLESLGEDRALVQPDGSTIASSYTPQFPRQAQRLHREQFFESLAQAARGAAPTAAFQVGGIWPQAFDALVRILQDKGRTQLQLGVGALLVGQVLEHIAPLMIAAALHRRKAAKNPIHGAAPGFAPVEHEELGPVGGQAALPQGRDDGEILAGPFMDPQDHLGAVFLHADGPDDLHVSDHKTLNIDRQNFGPGDPPRLDLFQGRGHGFLEFPADPPIC